MFIDLPLYYLLIPVLLLVWLYWYKPVAGLVAVLVLSPVYLIKSNIGFLPTTLLELFIYSLVIIQGIKSGLVKYSDWREKILVVKPLGWVLAWWILAAILATVFSFDLRLSLGVLKGWFIDPLLFLFLIIINIKSPIDYWRIIIGLVSGVSLISAYGLMELGLKIGLRSDGLLNSFYEPANYAAMLIVPIIFLGFSLAFLTSGNKWRWLVWFLVGLNILALYYTKSYGGYLAFGVGLLFYFWFYRKVASHPKILLVVFVSFIIVGGLLIFSQNKFQTLISNEQRTSLSTRQQIWNVSKTLITEKPVIGWGLGNFQESYRAQVKQIYPKPLEWQVVKAHNLYLNIWIEMGFLGLLVFIYLMGKIFVILRGQIRNNNLSRRVLGVGLISAWVAVLVHGLVDTPYFKNDLSLIFLTLVGLTLLLRYYDSWELRFNFHN